MDDLRLFEHHRHCIDRRARDAFRFDASDELAHIALPQHLRNQPAQRVAVTHAVGILEETRILRPFRMAKRRGQLAELRIITDRKREMPDADGFGGCPCGNR